LMPAGVKSGFMLDKVRLLLRELRILAALIDC
jgi:hypothetical protein